MKLLNAGNRARLAVLMFNMASVLLTVGHRLERAGLTLQKWAVRLRRTVA